MALNLPNFRQLTASDMGGFDLGAALSQGLGINKQFQEARTMPKQLAEELYAKQLQNKINAPKAEHANEITMADLAHTQAGTNHLNAETGMSPLRKQVLEAQLMRQQQLANDPFHGKVPTGTVAQAYWMDQIRKTGNPQLISDAERQLKLENESKQGLNNYRQELGKTLGKRSSTNLGKLETERAEAAAGYMPNSGGTVQLTPEQQQQLTNRYDLQIQKATSDIDTRKKNLYATNIDKTLDSINVDDLVRYGGLTGGIEKKLQEGKALTGRESEDYRKFQEALVGAKTLAKQVRQFYGDSITPQIQEGLKDLTNPASWTNNPEIAKRNFNKFKNILGSETQTYRDAMQDPGTYQGNQKNAGNFADKIKSSFTPQAQSLLNQWNMSHPDESEQHTVNELIDAAKELNTTPEEVMKMIMQKGGE